MTTPDAASGLVVVGANHRSSPVLLRDQLFVDDAAMPGFLATLRAAGIEQALALSTCDRVEVQAIHGDLPAATRAVLAALAERAGLAAGDLAGHFYSLEGAAALAHVFGVASALESQVIGEPQVFGQVKASHRLARAEGMVGSALEAVLQAAYATAKRVRSETAIAEQPVSIAAAAARLAGDVHGDLSRCTALLIGGDDMGELVAEHLIGAGLGRILVTAPGERRARAAARRFDCHVIPFEGFAAVLPDTDIIISSVGRRSYVVDGEMIEQALARRRRRPMFLVDAAAPGDMAPEIDRIDEAYLYDLDDLERVALAGQAEREAAAEAARAIVAEDVAAFLHDRKERRAVPAVTALRQHFEAVRAAVLREAGDDAERATRLLVRRLLHAPSAALRRNAAEADADERAAAEDLLRRLFRLGGKP